MRELILEKISQKVKMKRNQESKRIDRQREGETKLFDKVETVRNRIKEIPLFHIGIRVARCLQVFASLIMASEGDLFEGNIFALILVRII
jgi:hypothetical protein